MIGKLLGHTEAQTTAHHADLTNDPVEKMGGNASDMTQAAMLGKRGDPKRTEWLNRRKSATSLIRKTAREEAAVVAE